MPDIRLHPSGRLFLDRTPDESGDHREHRALEFAFQEDWRRGLFTLAADPVYQKSSLTIRFWREIAAAYLHRLCHLSNQAFGGEIEPLDSGEVDRWVTTAPPMIGGEYLNAPLIGRIWNDLAAWGASAMAQAGGPSPFIASQAPSWHRVGRVTFHLAENKQEPDRPFAFMASFTTGLDDQGRTRHLPLRQALQMYAGARNKAALIHLLTPVQEAARAISWVNDLVESGDLYRPMAWSATRAHQMLQSANELEAAGLMIRLPSWGPKTSTPVVTVTIGRQTGSYVGSDSILDFNVTVTIEGEQLTRDELQDLLTSEAPLVLFKGTWIEVDRRKLKEAHDRWQEAEKVAAINGLTFLEGMRLIAGLPADLKIDDPDNDLREWSEVVAGDGLMNILDGMRDPAALTELEAADGLDAILRPYQKEGVNWLNLLTGLGLGACLADDMGLGKTLQVLALLNLPRRQAAGPSLLVVPASLLSNWRAESERFTPDLNLLFLHSSQTDRTTIQAVAERPQDHLTRYDLVITTYGMALRLPWLAEQSWDLVILDEAQAIKNFKTRLSKAIRRLPARARIVLTGTPIENDLGDLWSLFSFLNPGLLGTVGQFKRFVKVLTDSPQASLEPLRKLVAPYILRRLKTDLTVIPDLPDKTETVRHCGLSRPQVKLYKQVVDRLERTLVNMEQGVERRGLVLQALTRLKQICNHPSQFIGDGQYHANESGKFAQLEALCSEIGSRQEKVLVFTQYREIIPALESHLAHIFGQVGLMLHGGTPVKKRQGMVDHFQADDGPPFFVISLKAGGTGLNLTAANHVIHFDRWWNPAVENQATDRAFRIGQQRNVLVHKFVTSGTIEERIDLLIADKKDLAEEVLTSDSVKLTELSNDELLELVRLDVNRALG